MYQKMIFWKSDLWPLTVASGVVTLVGAAFLVLQLTDGEPSGSLALGLALLLPLAVTLLCAFTDRSEAMRRTALFDAEPAPVESSRWASRLSEEMDVQSSLNPDNSDRAKDAMSKDPPPIG